MRSPGQPGKTRTSIPDYRTTLRDIVLPGLAVIGLYLVSSYNYGLFHSLVVLFVVIWAGAVFILTWNSRQYLDNKYFLFLGINAFFLCVMELAHALTYMGPQIIRPSGLYLHTQLWIATHYIQYLAFLLAPLFIRRSFNYLLTFWSNCFVVVVTLGTIFLWYGPFDMFMDYTGYITFLRTNGIVMVLILINAIILLSARRIFFDPIVFRFLIIYGLTGIVSEVFFAFPYNKYGFSYDAIGNVLRCFSFYLLYRAIVIGGLVRPHDVLFRNLVQHTDSLEKKASLLGEAVTAKTRELTEVNERLRFELSKRDEMKDVLRQSEEQFRTIFDNAGDAIFMNDARGRIFKANKIAVEHYGYSEDELLSMSIHNLDAPEERQFVPDRIEILHRRGYNIFETSFLRRDGTVVPVEVNSRLINYGDIEVALNIIRDISERKKTEKELEKNRLRFHSLFTNMAEGVCLHRLVCNNEGAAIDYEILDMNRQYEKILNVKKEDFVHKLASEVYGAGEPPYLKEFSEVVATGHPKYFETYFPPMDKHFYISATVTGRDEFATIFFDISTIKKVEEQLREDEERISLAARVATIGVWDLDIGSNLVFWDNRMFEVYGISREVPMPFGKWLNAIVDEDRDAVKMSLERAMSDKSYGHIEFRINRPDGVLRYIQMAHGVSLDDTGEARRLIGVNLDITERKISEEALRKSETTLKSVFRTTPVGIALVTPDRVIQMVNDAMSAYSGYSQEELEGQSARMLYCDDIEYNRIGELILDTVSRGDIGTIETRWLRCDGETRDVQARYALLDPKYPSAGIVFTAIDITEKKRTEAELNQYRRHLEDLVRERTAELESLYNDAPCGYHSLDEEGRIIRINDTEVNLFGYSREELLENKFSSFMSGEARETFEKGFSILKEKGTIHNIETEIVRKNGTLLPLLISATASYDMSGKFVHSRSTVLDNSERKRAELEIKRLNKELETRAQKLETINKELESFSYSVSHDLKAPLRGIEGYSRLLIEEYSNNLGPEGQRFLAAIRTSSGQMSQLIDDLLAYSRFERRNITEKTIQLSAFVKSVLAGYADTIKERNIGVLVSLPDITLTVDADGLGAVLRNLIENAIKFTINIREAKIRIEGEKKDRFVVLCVGDNGIGFEMKHHERIFEIFQRLHRTEDYPGTGIGLALARKAVQRMEGRIWAESEPGRGARFYLEIPCPAEE